MSEEMINLESYDTLGIRMENPVQSKLQALPQPPFFMDPKKALPFWLVRSLQDKMPMVSIPEKIKVPYTRGLVGKNLVQSLDPNEFVPLDPSEGRVEYAPLHDKNLKKFFKSPNIRKMVEKTGDLVEGRTACTLKEYNDYRNFVHRMLLNHVTQETREEEQLKAQELDIDHFLQVAKKEGKEKWNKRFKEYLKLRSQGTLRQMQEEKLKRCAKRLLRGEKACKRVKQMREKTQEMRNAKWVAYKKRMDNYFKAIKDDQRRRGIYARKRWMVEAVINDHRKSLILAENKLKRELVMEKNWNRRMSGQKLKLKKDKVVREQYHACIQLMKSRREKYYNRRDVEIDELLALPGMNSLDELEVFNTQFDQFSPEFVDALHGAKFYVNRSAKSLTLDKSLRKYIVHHESATERMKKANVARPIKHALDLIIRRSVGYYAMVVMYKTIMDGTPMALHLADKIQSSDKLRELLLEEYKQFGPRSDTPFQTVKKFEEDGLSHCMCDYKLVDKDTLEWPCPLCRTAKEASYVSEESIESSTCSIVDQEEELYVVGEGTTTVGFLVPPLTTEGHPEEILAELAVEVDELVVEGKPLPKSLPPATGLMSTPKEELAPEPGVLSEPAFGELYLKKKSSKFVEPKGRKGSRRSKRSSGSRKSERERRKKIKTSASSRGPRGKKMSAEYDPLESTAKRSPEKEAQSVTPPPTEQAEKPETVENVELLPKPPVSEPEEKVKNKDKKRSGSPRKGHDPRQSKKNFPKKSILKRKTGAIKQVKKKGVSFAEEAKVQKAARMYSERTFPSKETLSLVKASVSQPQFPSPLQIKLPSKPKLAKPSSTALLPNTQETLSKSSKSSIVSLLSITSDNRLHFVKGQCIHTDKGSKFGKIGGGEVAKKKETGIKKGFIKGTCRCFTRAETPPSDESQMSNITERLDGSISRRSKKATVKRWRGVRTSLEEEVSKRPEYVAEEPKDVAALIQELSPKKLNKIRYFIGAKDLQVVCHCEKCYTDDSPKASATMKEIEQTPEEQPAELAAICKCNLREKLKIKSDKQDRLAYITKVIGNVRKEYKGSTGSDTRSYKSRKTSARSVLEKHKSMISRLWKKKSVLEKPSYPITKRDPDVQKYYVDDVGNLYVLNRYGVRTHLRNVGKDFRIDEKGRKYFVDGMTGKKYLIDVTGRVYLETDNGDIQSLFYEEGKEYQDPEPKKLLMHDMVRESVVDLLQEAPQENFFDNEDELVELVYEYLYEGSEGSAATEPRASEVRSEESSPPDTSEKAVNAQGLGTLSSKALPESETLSPRMPIKRPLHSLIKEVPFNREISKLFIQRKKFHDCAAIVFRRTLLYSLASYTKIMERGFDASDEIGARKKITGLDGMVRGLTKITAHYPLKLIKSKRLASYVDALVQGFLGSKGYQIFPGRAPVFRHPSTPDETASAKGSKESVGKDDSQAKVKKAQLSEVEGIDQMKLICLCGQENAAAFIENISSMTTGELSKVAICKKMTEQ